MKTYIILIAASILCIKSFASLGTKCSVVAKVQKVNFIPKLGKGMYFNGTNGAVSGDFVHSLNLKIISARSAKNSDKKCPLQAGLRFNLTVNDAQVGTYVEDQVLNLTYQNIRNRKESKVIWLK